MIPLKYDPFREKLRGFDKKNRFYILDICYCLNEFNRWIQRNLDKNEDNFQREDLDYFLNNYPFENISANDYLKSIYLYQRFTGRKDIAQYAYRLRQDSIANNRRTYTLKKFDSIRKFYLKKLKMVKIKNIDDMLSAAAFPEQRKKLSIITHIREEELLRIAKLCDLARLKAVKNKRAHLYLLSGFDKIEKIAAVSPLQLKKKVTLYIKENELDYSPPTLKEAAYTVQSAQMLKSKVCW